MDLVPLPDGRVVFAAGDPAWQGKAGGAASALAAAPSCLLLDEMRAIVLRRARHRTAANLMGDRKS